MAASEQQHSESCGLSQLRGLVQDAKVEGILRKHGLAGGPLRSAEMEGEITQGNITRVLVIGFSAVIVLLGLGGAVALHNILSIQENAAKLVREQRVTRKLIENLQDEQKTLSAIFYSINGDPDTANPDVIRRRLVEVDKDLRNLERESSDAAQRPAWSELLRASYAFGLEAKRLLAEPDLPSSGSRELFSRHEKVIFTISRLVDEGFGRVTKAEEEIQNRSERLDRESLTLLFASLGLALICSIFTVRMTRQLFRNMAWQESELTRVSWQMLADQESIARRFSHELHDELGQTLAALKANLTALRPPPDQRARMDDSVKLLDDAIRNVRQLSQLLRPMMLDDFGLDAGLGWLCEGFMQRTGIVVEYSSGLHDRLPDATETHLFRMAQEALTNVARHSGATQVRMELAASADQVRLTIADNGRGWAEKASYGTSMGMTGMRARARAVGGVFRVSDAAGGGLQVEAVVPRMSESPESNRKETHESNSNLVS